MGTPVDLRIERALGYVAERGFPSASALRLAVYADLSRASGYACLRALRELGFIHLVTVLDRQAICADYHCPPGRHWHVLPAAHVRAAEWEVPAE